MTEALRLIREARELARASQNRKIAEASAQVLTAMAEEGILDTDTPTPFTIVMNELIASGALPLKSSVLIETRDQAQKVHR